MRTNSQLNVHPQVRIRTSRPILTPLHRFRAYEPAMHSLYGRVTLHVNVADIGVSKLVLERSNLTYRYPIGDTFPSQ